MDDVVYLTPEGAAKLKKELEELKGPAREALAKRLRAAIEQGDLSENADYTSAKEEQGFLEGRIQELELSLRNAVIIEEKVNREKAEIGSHITIQEDDFSPETYHLVGPKEADPRNGKISYESPIGKALLNRIKDDLVEVVTPGGTLHFKILKIE